MILTAIVNYLKTTVGIARVWSVAAKPNEKAPYVVVELEGVFRNRYWGSAGTATGLTDTDFEISCYGKTVQQSGELAKQITDALENYAGPMVGTESPAASYRVRDIEITSELQQFEQATELYRYSIFITVSH